MTSFRVAKGTISTGLLDAVSDTVELVCDGAPGVVAWLTNAATLTGFKVVFEGQLDGSAWSVIHFFQSDTTNKATPLVESHALTAVPAYFWSIPTQGVYRVRARCSGLLTGSVSISLKCTDHSVV